MADAKDIKALKALPVIISCQGGDYTNEIYPQLRKDGWKGYWIDAASALRMKDDAVIILDPVNMPVIQNALKSGTKDYIGGNCTVSLMLMGLDGLFKARPGRVDDLDDLPGGVRRGRRRHDRAGAADGHYLGAQVAGRSDSALDIDRNVTAALRNGGMPKKEIGYPLAASLLPWIDKDLGNGQAKEEAKAQAEGNKILGRSVRPIPIDGICVRIGAMRCHSQALTVKLKQDVPLGEIEGMLAEANDWVKVVPNRREESLAELTPAAVSGKLSVPVGRLRKMPMGGEYLTAFTVGDQLLWGAAEPLRRMVRILLDSGLREGVGQQGKFPCCPRLYRSKIEKVSQVAGLTP